MCRTCTTLDLECCPRAGLATDVDDDLVREMEIEARFRQVSRPGPVLRGRTLLALRRRLGPPPALDARWN